MDEHNVHHFWGISPALDLGSLLPTGDGAADLPVDQPLRFLQVAPYDARHTLTTIARASRHPALASSQQPVSLVVWEDCPEGLARHVLLAAVLLDGGVPAKQRAELLLELHGNAVLRQRAAEYLDEKARQLEALFVGLAAGQPPPTGPEAECRGLAALAQMLDLSLLKFQEKDLIVEALQRWRIPAAAPTTAAAAAAVPPYDMVGAWDGRCRKVYGERYDFRRNMVDWDYHMRLQPAGTPGCDPAAGSIIHFHHFRHWRLHGVAHELRDSAYNAANRSLLSTAYGRTKEFKDRSGKDVGRSVSAWGFWGDVLNSPYHCFGTACEERGFYTITNKQFVRTAVDVAEHNIMALLHELRTGQRLALGEGQEAHRAKVARGPTTIEDLTSSSAAAAAGAAPAEAAEAAGEAGEAAGAADSGAGGGEAAAGASGSTGAAAAVKEDGVREDWTAGATTAGAGAGQAVAEGQEAPGAPDPAAAAAAAAPTSTSTPAAPAAASTSSAAPTYSSGGRAQVAKAMAAAAAAAAGAAAAGASSSGGRGDAAAAAAPATATPAASSSSGAAGEAAAVAAGSGSGEPASTAPVDEAARQKMAAEEAAVRAAEAALDAAGRARAVRFRLVLVTGDLTKAVTGRAKYAGAFCGLSLGHRHTHLLEPQHRLAAAAAPGARLVAENARHVLQLSSEQAALFSTKMDELAAAGGWRPLPAGQWPDGVTAAAAVYFKPAAAGAAVAQ
ncbi:hypothetical protein HXX76_014762 [Chlamydomonas incerta]|uniref:Dynein assembly factor 3, axonemal n=1 Tax=Chlamydomonas incerta TaxID=51695 RepID=A0A835SQE1_CHLIN|nr:hypothetical protein HXX76_014762 [Chlamydomonas incerta]|eukprot:KAG2424086.1 hypothetical protein HXX76_014762 [Chlamydomonas incerta]